LTVTTTLRWFSRFVAHARSERQRAVRHRGRRVEGFAGRGRLAGETAPWRRGALGFTAWFCDAAPEGIAGEQGAGPVVRARPATACAQPATIARRPAAMTGIGPPVAAGPREPRHAACGAAPR
jgi:hypothetical protein